MLNFEPHDAADLAVKRKFLDRYVFRKLGAQRVSFDVEAIAHFTPQNFLQVLERCHRFGVAVHGVELFTAAGEPVHLELSSDGEPYSLLPAVLPFCRFDGITVCATYTVPRPLLSAPAVSAELTAAYTDCQYDVFSEEVISLRVGERNDGLERLLKQRGVQAAFLITACSPFSRVERASSEVANAALQLDLERSGASLLPTIAARGTSWEEQGFLALGLSEADARRVGDEYGQNAVLSVDCSGYVELVLLR